MRASVSSSRLSTGGAVLGRLLTPRKRVDVLIDAFARLGREDVVLVIAGNDLAAGRAIRARAPALRLEPQTVFAGLLRGRKRLEAWRTPTSWSIRGGTRSSGSSRSKRSLPELPGHRR